MDSAISLSERNIFVKQFDFENTKLLKSYRHVPWIESLAVEKNVKWTLDKTIFIATIDILKTSLSMAK